MAKQDARELPIARIEVRLCVGQSLMAASDDPLFLGLRGASGREFRLVLAESRSLRRGGEDRFVLGAPSDPETNVEHAEMNDPTRPLLDAATITSTYLRKGFEPIPNVRGRGEMDDRLEIVEVEVELHSPAAPKPIRFARSGPIWLGLIAGLRLEIPRTEESA